MARVGPAPSGRGPARRLNRSAWVVLAATLAALGACSSEATALPTPRADVSTSTSPAEPGATADVSAPPVASAPPATNAPTTVRCGDPSAHVYHPYRLEIRNACQVVSGVIAAIRTEADGDLHVLLRLDPQYGNLINSMNVQGEHGDLVLEPVCEGQVTQADAVSACSGYSNPIRVPGVGTHVTATGAYVLDQQHGWMELHPLFDIHPG